MVLRPMLPVDPRTATRNARPQSTVEEQADDGRDGPSTEGSFEWEGNAEVANRPVITIGKV